MDLASSSQSIDQLSASRDRFLRFVQRRIADPELAEDVLQSSFLKAVEAAPLLRDDQRLIPWFYSILRNSIVDAYRRRAVEDRLVDERTTAAVPIQEDRLGQRCRCVEALIPGLKPEYGELIERLELQREPAGAVAARLGLSATNLKVRRHRARRALRRRLEETCGGCAQDHCLDCTCSSRDLAGRFAAHV